MTSARRARLSALVIAALVPAALVLGAAAPAQAHDELIGSTPEADASVADLPAVTLEYTAELLRGGANLVQVVGPDGLFYDSGCTVVEGTTASVETALGAQGAYEIRWQVVSSDGHPISGTVPFTYAPADGATEYAGSETARACGEEYRVEAGAGQVTASPSPGADPDPGSSATPTESAGEAQPTTGTTEFPVLPVVIGGLVLVAVAVAVLYVTRRTRNGV